MFEFIDVEASGLSDESYPIEIGFTTEKETFSYLIKPDLSWTYWDNIAESDYHNISRDELFIKGFETLDIISILNEKLKGMILYSDSINFDSFWINKLFRLHEKEKTFKLKSIQELLSTTPISDYQFFEKKEELVDVLKHHKAGYDAALNKKTYYDLISKI